MEIYPSKVIIIISSVIITIIKVVPPSLDGTQPNNNKNWGKIKKIKSKKLELAAQGDLSVRCRTEGVLREARIGWVWPAEEADQSRDADHTLPSEVHQPGSCGMASGNTARCGGGRDGPGWRTRKKLWAERDR